MATLFASRARAAAQKTKPTRSLRCFSSALTRFQQKSDGSSDITPPKPPPTTDDSTSALDYKSFHRTRPPPLPSMDLPRARSAEEAVTNILYNTPPPSLQPFKNHVLNCLVQNEPGVLSRISGILAGRAFNIDSLVVCSTEIRDLSRMTIVLKGQDGVVEQARRQLEDLVPVWAVLDYTETQCIERELLLVKISTLGPEYVDDQLAGGPSLAPRRYSERHSKLQRETALAENFEHAAEANAVSPDVPVSLTPTQTVHLKSQNLQSINLLASQFGGRIVDVSDNSVIVEMSGKSKRVDAFLSLLKPFGVLESARTGLMVMPRTPIAASEEDDVQTSEGGVVDASLLPPG